MEGMHHDTTKIPFDVIPLSAKERETKPCGSLQNIPARCPTPADLEKYSDVSYWSIILLHLDIFAVNN